MKFFGRSMTCKQVLAILALMSCGEAVAWASDVTSRRQDWISSAIILEQHAPAEAIQTLPWLAPFHAIVLRSLLNPEQAKEMLNLHNAHGTKASSSYGRYVGPLKIAYKPENTQAVLSSLSRSLKLYVQKETKGDILPQSWRQGLKFKIGSARSESRDVGVTIMNGNPGLRYGLILHDIEPSLDSMRIVSRKIDDYSLVDHAPKASVQYRIGEIYPESQLNFLPLALESVRPESSTVLSGLPSRPEFRFNGRVAPRGMPAPGSPLPPQSLFLEQTQGYYQLEAQLDGRLKQEAVLHRLKLPLASKLSYRQERNKDLRLIKTSFDNLYCNQQGLAVNLERYHLERRYQLNFNFTQGQRRFEVFAHLPDSGLSSSELWRQYRWETRLDFRF